MVTRVLVGVDFSDASRTALMEAKAWADRLDVPLEAMHVLQPPAPMLPEAQVALPDPGWLEDMQAHAQVQLQAWVADLPGTTCRVCWGSPADELAAAADPETLLVVSRVGHARLAELLFGSTAIRTVKLAPCHVLVVHR